MNWGRLGFLAWGVSLIACATGTTPKQGAPRGGAPHPATASAYDDRTIARLTSEAELNDYCFTHSNLRELKFIITDFSDSQARSIRFIDARFYQYHDEWYWFRLLNGKPVPGDDQEPFFERTFSSPAEATAWGIQQAKLPARLSMVEDGRLYAPRFYQLALEVAQPSYGLGSIFELPSSDQGSRWAFELEYADQVNAKRVSYYFSLLKESILPQMAAKLVFVARSPQQYAFVEQLRAEHHPLASSLKLSSEFAEAGVVQVYQPGLTAGTLRVVDSSELESFESKDSEILLLPLVPDYLPAAAGIVSAVPQTPLSHVNLLARNRGIPNVYLGRAAENRHINQLARAEMPVVMLAESGQLAIEALDARVYELWKRLTLPAWRQAPQVNVASLPYTRRLRPADFDHVDELRPLIGGKAAGTLALLAAGVRLPPSPIAMTVRSYVEHIAPALPLIEAALDDPEFVKSPRVRFLVLEGRARYEKHYRAPADQQFADKFVASRGEGKDAVLELIRQGGISGWIRSREIEPSTLRLIVSQLRENFAASASRDGLRFRSSSTIEDIEGFNGAGLYDSNTGFFDAPTRASNKEQKQTVQDAILRTWASYWGSEAFEERERAQVDHLSGGMAVLVHPRFEDSLELANGVFSFTVNRRSADPSAIYEMELNVQRFAESVTNPKSGVTPEVVHLSGNKHGKLTHRVLAAASGSSSTATVLSPGQMAQLFRDAASVAEAWLLQENRDLSLGKRRAAVTLDFEFRLMEAGWARTSSPATDAPAQMILKQVRSLEPALLTTSPELAAAPIPRELLGRAMRVEQMICSGDALDLTVLRLWTDPLSLPDFGFAREPFVAAVSLQSRREGSSPMNAWFKVHGTTWEHERLRAGLPVQGPDDERLNVGLEAVDGNVSANLSLSRGELEFKASNRPELREAVSCHKRVLLDDPDRLLREELDKMQNRSPPGKIGPAD